MRYTEPTIVNVSNAASLIKGQTNKFTDNSDGGTAPHAYTDPPAYEADE